MDLFQKCKDFKLVDEVKEAGIYPYFHTLESKQDVVVNMEGGRKIMIGSNNYQGLTSDPRVIAASVKAVEEFGTGCSGSRFLNGTTSLHIQLEKELAEFLGKEDCVTMGSGFQTNIGVISAIAGRKDYIFCDKENHASIYDGCKLSYAKMVRFNHLDYDDLERKLQEVPDDAGILIITDGIFSMTGDICDLPRLVEIKKEYGARLMVDDAHALGVIGKGGRGTASHFGLEDQVDIYMGTFSKSLASLGGYMAASREVVEYVRHVSRPFIFSASITPASAATALAALRQLKNHPELVDNLQSISARLRKNLLDRDVHIIEAETPIIPIYTYTEENTLVRARMAYDAGVYLNPVITPACAENECLLRASLMATHTPALVDEAAEIIAAALKAPVPTMA